MTKGSFVKDESLVTLEWEKYNGHSSQTYHKVTGDEKKKRSESQSKHSIIVVHKMRRSENKTKL